MSMNQEIKARWTAALRSGEYQQGKGVLRKNGKLCCLGVLCELAVKDGVITSAISYPDDDYSFTEYGEFGEELNLPLAVMGWAGLDSSNPEVDLSSAPEGVIFKPGGNVSSTESPSLAGINDSGTPFAVIADVIDAQF